MSGPVGRRSRFGLRTRILAGYVSLLTLATGVTVVIERRALVANLDQRIAAELEQEVDEVERLLGGRDGRSGRCRATTLPDGRCEVGRDPATGEPFGDDAQALFDTFLRRSIPGEHETKITYIDGRVHGTSADNRPIELHRVPGFSETVARVAAPTRGEIDSPAGRVRYLAAPIGDPEVGATFVVAQFLAPQLAQVRESARIAILANLLVLGVASLLAYGATGRLLRPVAEVTATATAISDTDLSRRIEVHGQDEISRLAATFNDMLDRLEEAFASQRRFFDDVGHELRTPITIVRGNLELLPDQPEGRARAVAIATDELDRMARMVDDLLTLARAERPDFVTLEPTDLRELLLETAEKAEAIADRRWHVVPPPEGSEVFVDPQRIAQALLQLIDNAVGHTVAGDRVELEGRVGADQVVLTVRDDGRGLDPQDLERIFDRFERGSRPSRDGTGLGLSIVAAIARAHGGTVHAEGAPGRGASFTVTLPAARPAAPAASRSRSVAT